MHLDAPEPDLDGVLGALDDTLSGTRDLLRAAVDADPSQRRMWHLVSFLAATLRGILADGVVTDPDGFRRANQEEFLDWSVRHGADPGGGEFAFIRGLYDLVFAHDGERRSELGVGAGTAIAVNVKMFFEYRGAIFWKMAAGMGDVVFAPLHQALVARGVRIEYFHRVDELEPSADGTQVETITMGRQVALRDGVEQYDPLVRVRGLLCFADRPLLDQLDVDPAVEHEPLESHLVHVARCGAAGAAARRGLRRRRAGDAGGHGAPRRARSRRSLPAFDRMLTNLRTTATVALQLWLREDEPTLGWGRPGMTVSAFERPLSTWASMPQLIPVEDWPEAMQPRLHRLLLWRHRCALATGPSVARVPRAHHLRGRTRRPRRSSRSTSPSAPGPARPRRNAGGTCCAGGTGRPRRLSSQFVRINVDPSDRYVMCVPGSDQHRLRSDESGFDNLFLAGDWTDNGINAGCIEAAVLSGLQAANAVLGRPRDPPHHRNAPTLIACGTIARVTDRAARWGYPLVLLAAALFGLNAGVSRIPLRGGTPTDTFTTVRITIAFLAFVLIALLVDRSALRIPRGRALLLITGLGIVGFAGVQWTYNVAINRLPLGIALLLEYLGPVLVVLWVRFARREHVHPRMWPALVLAVGGLAVVSQVWQRPDARRSRRHDGLGCGRVLRGVLPAG